jgi:hypothetical protein
MAYTPEERFSRMKELAKPIDQQIMMCDDEQDLLALASIMLVSARAILVTTVGEDVAKQVMIMAMKGIK